MIIRLLNLHIAYPGRVLLEVADEELRPGKLHLLIGSNGIGKSSLLRTMAGLQAAHSGQVLIGDTDLAALTQAKRSSLVHYLPGRQVIRSRIRLSEYLEIGAASHFRGKRGASLYKQRLAEVLQVLGLEALHESYVCTLSDGEFQKMTIALVMLRESEVVLLDEPLSHLDPPAQAEMLALFKQMATERVLLMSTHSLAAIGSDEVVVYVMDGDRSLKRLAGLDTMTEAEIVALYK